MRNKIHLIAYSDRLSTNGIKGLIKFLDNECYGLFGGIHLLPFYYPVDGADAGFDPIDHKKVDRRLGTWEDIKELAENYDLVADIIVNHISADSAEFKDYLENGERSDFNGLFLTREAVFGHRAAKRLVQMIYRPRPGEPFIELQLNNGSKEHFWTTFSPNQIDIDVAHPLGKQYLSSVLKLLANAGVRLIRLDAVGYARKKPGTTCFMIPETYEFIHDLSEQAHSLGMKILVEIHSHYLDQLNIAEKVDFVYDFALPPLVLNALYKHSGQYLNEWFKISPRNAITVLDTHDGIGIIDIGSNQNDETKKGLIPDEEIIELIEEMHRRTGGQSINATGEGAMNLDLYQVNSTFYDVLGQNDDLYILARAIQFFSPGIPQVYYMGLFAEPNDVSLFKSTGVGRNINRHYFTDEELIRCLERPVVRRLIKLMSFRNKQPAFNGVFSHELRPSGEFIMMWKNDVRAATLEIDFSRLKFAIINQTRPGLSETLIF